jgi:hypothetical protein
LYPLRRCCVIAAFGIYRKDWEDVYMTSAVLMWLGGNYVWMAGELTEVLPNPDDDGDPFFGTSTENTLICLHMFIAALCLLALHYCMLRPMGIINSDKHVEDFYKQREFFPRFPSYFKNLRQYEYLHTLCWIAKDVSWNRLWPIPWCIAFFFTFTIAIDFIYLSYKKRYWVDFAHFCAQLLWVTANFAWGYGEQFAPQHDIPIPIWDHSHLALVTGRWWAEVTLMIAYVPNVLLVIWLLHAWYVDSTPDGSSGSASEPRGASHVGDLSTTGDDMNMHMMSKDRSSIISTINGRMSRILSVSRIGEQDGGDDALGRSSINPLQSVHEDL